MLHRLVLLAAWLLTLSVIAPAVQACEPDDGCCPSEQASCEPVVTELVGCCAEQPLYAVISARRVSSNRSICGRRAAQRQGSRFQHLCSVARSIRQRNLLPSGGRISGSSICTPAGYDSSSPPRSAGSPAHQEA